MSHEKMNRLKAVLAEEGKTQKWLSEETGMHVNTVARICRNEVQTPIENFFLFAHVLEVPICSLFFTKEKATVAVIDQYKNGERPLKRERKNKEK